MVTDVYEQYFKAKCIAGGVPRKAAIVKLTSDSEAGMIKYSVSVNFFPYRDPEDFAVSYDVYVEKEIYNAKGRRSKKREKEFMASLRDTANEIAAGIKGKIFWDEPLREARLG